MGILTQKSFLPNLDCGCFITHLQKDRALKAPLRIRVRPSLFATYFLIGTNRTRCMHCTACSRNKCDNPMYERLSKVLIQCKFLFLYKIENL